MCPRSSLLAILVACLTLPGVALAQRAEVRDPVEAYLLDRGFTELLALHWERRLPEARGDKREQLLGRLAEVYGDLLSKAVDEEERRRWERKSRQLLPEMGEVEGTALSLSLIRARYLPSEQVAERQRLRLAEGAELDQARRDLDAVVQELGELDGLLIDRLAYLETVSRREGSRGERAAEVFAELSELQSWVRFYLGWSQYYQAMLTGEVSRAYDAMLAFALLLGQEPGRLPSLRVFPADRMRFEMQARAALGVALCLSVRGEANEAIRWLDAIAEGEDVAPNIAAQVPVRKLIVLGEGGQWMAFSRVRSELERERQLTPLDARLIAVLALDWCEEEKDETALSEASYALASLSDAGELGHVVDLVRLYGSEALGTTGFIGQFVKGLDSFQRARTLHERRGDPDLPSDDADVIERYRPAIQYLRSAVAGEDAGRFPEARDSAERHLGLSLYFSSRFLEAATVFREAANLDTPEAEESLHLAIISLEAEARSAEKAGRSAAETLRDLRRLIDAYLRRFSSGTFAHEVLVKKATLGGLEADDSLVILLEIPEGDSNYEQARRHAARLLWDMYSQAEPFDRPALGQRYLRVAVPLLGLDRERGQTGDAQAQALFVGRARRVLTAAMTFGLEDRAIAVPWLGVLERVEEQGWAGTETLRHELVYRRVQLLTATGQIEEAAEHLAAAREGTADRYLKAATRRVFDSALIAWKSEQVKEAMLDLVLRFGELLVADAGGDELAAPALGRPVLQALAEAHAHVGRTDDSQVARQRALALYDQLIVAGLGTAEIQSSAGRLAETLGEPARALAAWQAAAAYLEPGEEAWYEARYQALRLLADLDPRAASEALAQHETLYPGPGPQPWGDLIRDLAARLPLAPEPEEEGG
jgi:tetratricopeptide (TPR) repeat protein